MLDRLVGYRINRATYWLNLIAVICLLAVASYLEFSVSSAGIAGIMVLSFIAGTRLHDIGKTAKIALFGALIHTFLQIVGFVTLGVELGLVFAGVVNLILLVAMVWLGSIKGDPNANAWGDPPPPGISWQRPKPS
ncbi:hypothetical protein ACRAQ7_10990 [Erythrobacter sp. W53]|uniref:hypothetical protein n=1 Tax=Erythrobacter sp. W53 TaxID=3425947 RepID=UPI003D7687BB